MTETFWQFYTDTDKAWESMLYDINAAEVSIDLEQYIFALDDIGNRFVQTLIKKSRSGVKVRLLCDAVGSTKFFVSAVPEELKREKIDVQFYNPISPWRLYNFTSWFLRDHRKILVIDGRVGHTGSLGINQNMSLWRDTHVRLTGGLVQSLMHTFDQMWTITKLNKKIHRFDKYPSPSPKFDFVLTTPHIRSWTIRRRFIEAIRGAKKYIYLTTPYFVPDLGFFRALRLASKRGVDVRLILPVSSDITAVDIASASYVGLALKSGIKVYYYHNKFLHAKTAVIDDEWSTVGSANLDNLSFRYNFEANIISMDPKFCSELKEHFFEDLKQTSQINEEAWKKRSILQKISEIITWPVHNFF